MWFFFLDFIYLFLERGQGREKEEKKHQCVVASHIPPTWDLAQNPGMCPDWELNWQPFGSHAVLNPLSPTSQGKETFIEWRNELNGREREKEVQGWLSGSWFVWVDGIWFIVWDEDKVLGVKAIDCF